MRRTLGPGGVDRDALVELYNTKRVEKILSVSRNTLNSLIAGDGFPKPIAHVMRDAFNAEYFWLASAVADWLASAENNKRLMEVYQNAGRLRKESPTTDSDKPTS